MADVLPTVTGDGGPVEATPVVVVNPDGAFSGVSVLGKQSFTRPADTTAYAAGDLVANSTTAGSVAPLTFTGAGASGEITGVIVNKSGAAVAQIRVHFTKTAHAVTNGDNGSIAFTSIDIDNYIGFADVNLADIAAGGALGAADVAIDYATAAGSLYAFIEALAAFTPASAEVFTVAPRVRKHS